MAELDLRALLHGRVQSLQPAVDEKSSPMYGVTLGVVTDTNDTKGLGRVRVRFPWLSNRVETAWARIAAPWAGQRRGSYFLPDVDDEVLVAFRHGDLSYPYILGFLWSDQDPPPESSPQLERKELRTKRGSVIVFDDTEKKESISVRSPAGLEVSVDDGAQQVRIADRQQTLKIVVSTSGNGEISISATKGDLKLEAPLGQVSVKASRIEMNASGALKLVGHPINLNPPA
jgi:uncharacterized protein involved in type VI secretion and phage assembly